MKLRITTPLERLIDEDGVSALRAEDPSGCFGILPGHADFLTSLTVCVVSWKNAAGGARYCAVRRGVLTVLGGQTIAIATREAVPGDDLATLDGEVLRRFRADLETQRIENVASARLQLDAVRRLMKNLRPQRAGGSARYS